MDVVGGAQGGRDLVAAAAGRAHVDDDPQRVPAGDAGVPDELLADDVAGRSRRSPRGRAPTRRSCATGATGRGSTSWRRAASSEAISSEDGDVLRTSRTARATASASMRPVGATCSIADWVSEPTILCVEVSTASAPCWSADGGRSGWKPKCEPHAWSTTSGTPAARADRGAAGDVGRHPVVGRRDDQGGAGVRRRGQRGLERLRGDAVGHPELGLVLRGDVARPPAGEHEAVDHRGVRVALHDDGRAQRREREAERVVALRGAVGQEPRARRPVGLGGELLGALEGRRLGPEVDAVDVLRDVEHQRVLADRRAQPGVGARAAPCGRGRGSGSSRGSRRRRPRRGRARSAGRSGRPRPARS